MELGGLVGELTVPGWDPVFANALKEADTHIRDGSKNDPTTPSLLSSSEYEQHVMNETCSDLDAPVEVGSPDCREVETVPKISESSNPEFQVEEDSDHPLVGVIAEPTQKTAFEPPPCTGVERPLPKRSKKGKKCKKGRKEYSDDGEI